MTREIKVDRDVCMGSGQCSIYAPNTFDHDDDGIAFVVDQNGDSDDAVANAVTGCPTQAISVRDVPDAAQGTDGDA